VDIAATLAAATAGSTTAENSGLKFRPTLTPPPTAASIVQLSRTNVSQKLSMGQISSSASRNTNTNDLQDTLKLLSKHVSRMRSQKMATNLTHLMTFMKTTNNPANRGNTRSANTRSANPAQSGDANPPLDYVGTTNGDGMTFSLSEKYLIAKNSNDNTSDSTEGMDGLPGETISSLFETIPFANSPFCLGEKEEDRAAREADEARRGRGRTGCRTPAKDLLAPHGLTQGQRARLRHPDPA
jgi:hypothetical protein